MRGTLDARLAGAYSDPSRGDAALAILLETARRIRARHKLSMAEIDRTGVLPYKLRTTSDWGAIWAENMRCGGASALSCRFTR